MQSESQAGAAAYSIGTEILEEIHQWTCRGDSEHVAEGKRADKGTAIPPRLALDGRSTFETRFVIIDELPSYGGGLGDVSRDGWEGEGEAAPNKVNADDRNSRGIRLVLDEDAGAIERPVVLVRHAERRATGDEGVGERTVLLIAFVDATRIMAVATARHQAGPKSHSGDEVNEPHAAMSDAHIVPIREGSPYLESGYNRTWRKFQEPNRARRAQVSSESRSSSAALFRNVLD